MQMVSIGNKKVTRLLAEKSAETENQGHTSCTESADFR